jgi:hypothetical protein
MGDEPVPNLRGGGMVTAAFVLGPLLGVVVMVGGLIWQAAHYPTREEFRAAQDTIHSLDRAVGVQGAHVEALRDQVGAVKEQGSRIEQKLNDLARKR